MLLANSEAPQITQSGIEILLKNGANVNAFYQGLSRRESSGTPLVEALSYRNSNEVISLLIEAGADVNMGDGYKSPLHAAANFYNTTAMVKRLVEAGADLNKCDWNGKSVIHWAVNWSGNCLNLLIELGADVNIVNNDGKTVLMLSAASSRAQQQSASSELTDSEIHMIERLLRLLKAGAQIGHFDNKGRNALHLSITREPEGNLKELQMILYAAGETIEGSTVTFEDNNNSGEIQVELPEHLLELKENLDLKNLCREAIRKYLLHLDPHTHLFGRIPELGLPSLLDEYMLYDCSLDFFILEFNEEGSK